MFAFSSASCPFAPHMRSCRSYLRLFSVPGPVPSLMGGAGGAGGAALAPSCRRDFFGCGAAPGLPLSGSRFGGLLVGAEPGLYCLAERHLAQVPAVHNDCTEQI